MAADVKIVRLALKDKDLLDRIEKALKKIGGMALQSRDDQRPPDLLIYELGADPRKDLLLIQGLLQDNRVGEVFLAAENPEPELLMEAMRAGVKEFLPKQLSSDKIEQALERFKQRNEQAQQKLNHKKGQVISVVGSKGGVGATTVAVNLAVALSQKKSPASVALLDMNTLFGEIPLFLEIKPKFHWGEITRHIDRLDSSLLMNVLSEHPSGIHVLSSPAYLNGHVNPTPAIMTNLLDLMKSMFDYIIVDDGQSLDPAALKMLELSDQLLLVTILSLPCLSNANRLKKSLGDLNFVKKEKIKIVINRYIKKGEISLKDAEKGIEQEAFWLIPNDYQTTMAAINNGKPLSEIAPRSEISKSFRGFAERVAPTEAEGKKKRWRLFGG